MTTEPLSQNQLCKAIATHLRDVFTGKNWCLVNFEQVLQGVDWQQANYRIGELHTLADLVFHCHYFIRAVIQQMEQGVLDAHDSLSFPKSYLSNESEWTDLKQMFFKDVEMLGQLIEKMPETQLWENFVLEKYGNYYRNLHGIIEHCHYHLGQMVILKKLIQASGK